MPSEARGVVEGGGGVRMRPRLSLQQCWGGERGGLGQARPAWTWSRNRDAKEPSSFSDPR